MHRDTEYEERAMSALAEAVKIFGTDGIFAAAISTPQLPVKASKVAMWRFRRSVPAEYVPAIYRATGVEPERFCPAVDWDALRCAA